MSDVRIRTARGGDVHAVLQLWGRAAHGASITDDADGVTRLLARDPDALLVATVGAEIVGTVIAGWDGWRCHLYRLAVAPEHRRAGIATALLEKADARFIALGGRRGDAIVFDDNERAHAVWAANGYARGDDVSRWTKWLVTGA